MTTPERKTLLQEMYAAFNARDTEAVLARMAGDVAWPKAFEGGSATGHDEVREYWRKQWSEIDPHVEPVAFADREDGRTAVTVAQKVRSLDGAVLFDGQVLHVYAFDAGSGLISAMVIEDGATLGP
jgi:ketosteroid isomerase-like protein